MKTQSAMSSEHGRQVIQCVLLLPLSPSDICGGSGANGESIYGPTFEGEPVNMGSNAFRVVLIWTKIPQIPFEH